MDPSLLSLSLFSVLPSRRNINQRVRLHHYDVISVSFRCVSISKCSSWINIKISKKQKNFRKFWHLLNSKFTEFFLKPSFPNLMGALRCFSTIIDGSLPSLLSCAIEVKLENNCVMLQLQVEA